VEDEEHEREQVSRAGTVDDFASSHWSIHATSAVFLGTAGTTPDRALFFLKIRHMRIPCRTLLALLLPLAFLGCRNDDDVVEPTPTTPASTGTLRIVVVPKWEGGPFALNTVYTNVSDYRVKVEAIKFYLGNVRLLTGTTSSDVKDVDYFDLHNGAVSKDWTAEPGTWTGLHIGFGVPQALNDADPIVYPPGHPLDLANATYWGWAQAYRFFQFDGRYDMDAGGTAAPALPFSMHTGLNACYTEFDLDLGTGVTITAGNTTTLTIDLAVDRFFYTAADTLDLATENQTHGTNLPLALELTNNAIHSFSVE